MRTTSFAGVLIGLLFLGAAALPAVAQQRVPLKAAHGGQILPEGTEVAVLRKPSAARVDTTFQPEFLPRAAFPRNASLLVRRETLGTEQRTAGTYPRTRDSGQLYFLYARTPDGRLYWSYSALKDSLKFDVVDKGVMSVAPVTDEAVKARILQTYFEAASAEPAEDPLLADADTATATEVIFRALSDTTTDSTALAAAASDDAAFDSAVAALLRDTLLLPPAEAGVEPEPMRRAAAAGGVLLSTWLFASLLVVAIALLATAGYVVWTYRQELVIKRRELMDLRSQLVGRSVNPDRRDDLDRRRDDLDRQYEALEHRFEASERRREELEQEYHILKARHGALKLELEALLSDPALSPPPTIRPRVKDDDARLERLTDDPDA